MKSVLNFTSPLTSHSDYRSDIDGLRALAVMLVVLFHAFPNYLKGGYIGVDIFFVISGYLISGIIFTKLQKNQFSFIDFYIKRINRIFPALIVVLGICILLSKYFLFTNEIKDFNHSLVAAASFVANIFFFFQSDYFDAAAETKPLLHLWSLGIEEQFYIVWPILLIILWKRSFNKFWLMGSLLVISMFINIAIVNSNQTAAFYLPFSRFWELLAGSALAYWHITKPVSPEAEAGQLSAKDQLLNRMASQSASALGLLFIIAGVLLLNRNSLFPGWWALLPVVGSVLIIAAGKNTLVNKYVLSNRLAIFIGVISYPIYLWHWPLLSFLHIEMGSAPKEYRLAAVVLSILLAWLTYLFVEHPIRFVIKSRIKTVVISLILVVLALYGYIDSRVISQSTDAKNAFISYYKDYPSSHHLSKEHHYECSLTYTNGQEKIVEPSCYTPTNHQSVLIWGDSHAQQLYPGLRKYVPTNISVLQIATFGCVPSVSFSHASAMTSCDKSNQLAMEKIVAVHPDVVILAQKENHQLNHWDLTIAALKEAGVKNIYVIGPVPEWSQYLNRYYARHFWDTKPQRLKENLMPETFQTDQVMKKMFADNKDATYISMIDVFCNTKGCLTYIGSNPEEGLTTFDYGHLTLIASDFVAENRLKQPILLNLAGKQSR